MIPNDPANLSRYLEMLKSLNLKHFAFKAVAKPCCECSECDKCKACGHVVAIFEEEVHHIVMGDEGKPKTPKPQKYETCYGRDRPSVWPWHAAYL